MEHVVLTEGLRLHRLGICVIPLKPKSKTPAIRSWKQYQTNRPDEATIYRWWANNPDRGLAIVLGEVSLCIGVRDFDSKPAYEAWAAKHPELAAKLPTVETSRGRHVYFVADFAAIRERGSDTVYTFDDGELRLSGCYVAAPPSFHPSGSQYRWLIPMVELPPEVDVFSCGFMPCNRENREDRDTEIHKKPRKPKTLVETAVVTPIAAWKASDFAPDVLQSIRQAVLKTVPKERGQRHKLVFELCRELKAIPAITDAHPLQLMEVFRFWWDLARAHSPTPWEEHLADFLEGWGKVKYPKGCEPLALALRRAKEREPPACALQFEQTPLRLLVSLCCEMQRDAGEGVFFLSSRKAGDLLEVTHVTAHRWLNLLKNLSILDLVEVGSQNPADRRASRFRYLPPI